MATLVFSFFSQTEKKRCGCKHVDIEFCLCVCLWVQKYYSGNGLLKKEEFKADVSRHYGYFLAPYKLMWQLPIINPKLQFSKVLGS